MFYFDWIFIESIEATSSAKGENPFSDCLLIADTPHNHGVRAHRYFQRHCVSRSRIVVSVTVVVR